jgi:hypothetical protein
MSDKWDDLIETLKQQRDELRVQMHLASLDAKDEFDELEKKWDQWSAEAKAQAKPLSAVIEDSAKNVGSALDLVLDEVKQSYDRIKGQIESKD